MPLRNLVILFFTAIISLICYQTAIRNHYGGLLASAIGEISQNFVEPVDQRELFEGALHGMVEQLDPYSDYISPKELSEFQEELDQEFGGIGIVVGVAEQTQRLTVLSPLPGTPAYEAGLRAGDTILTIDGQSTEGFQLPDAVKLMRGEAGTMVRLTVLQAGSSEPIELELERATIPIASVLGDTRNPDGSWNFSLEQDDRLGYIRLVTFGDQTTEELEETIQSLQGKIDGLLLDLRGNAGGLLAAAVESVDMFIDEGTIVSIRGRNRVEWKDYEATRKATICRDMPLVVLVDHYSASASEIVAASLQDHQRAIVVGDRTWGKGTVQNVIPFEGGASALKLTTATYWRPNGENIHRSKDAKEEDAWGVTPDPGYELKLDDEEFRKLLTYRRERDYGAFPESQKELSEPTDQAKDAEQESETETEKVDLYRFRRPSTAKSHGSCPATYPISSTSGKGRTPRTLTALLTVLLGVDRTISTLYQSCLRRYTRGFSLLRDSGRAHGRECPG